MAEVIKKLFWPCPGCDYGEFQFDHLSVGQQVHWCCDGCNKQIKGVRLGRYSFDAVLTGWENLPMTFTLRSRTEPPIEVKVNGWKYEHSKNDTPEEYFDDQEYFYNTHTCPTNWLRDVEQISVGKDTDPHGLFHLVSIEEGHFKDPSVLGE